MDAYVRMRCDPVMMADLGGPLSPEGIEDKVRRDVAAASADTSWIKMIIPGDDAAQVIDQHGELITIVPRNSTGEISRFKAYGS